MKKIGLIGLLTVVMTIVAEAQFSRDDINSNFVLYQRRVDFDKYMREKTINAVFAQPLDSTTEEKYAEACEAISQFLLHSPEIENGFSKMFAAYQNMETMSRRALLEAVYGVYPFAYTRQITEKIQTEDHPKLFAMMALYLYRIDHSAVRIAQLRKLLAEKFPAYLQEPILNELDQYLLIHQQLTGRATPNIGDLFLYQKQHHYKTIYSFQRWNRNYPGLVIIQNADGSFVKDSTGKLMQFRQLARSASDLPYFITNGSTPQGIYSIQGTAVSANLIIGPTPNIQLVMPNEADSLFWHGVYDSTQTAVNNYLGLLPPSWRNYTPMTESFQAGKIGRTEIIAHGTTIDPEYFKDKPYYPLTPTMGCLCAPENWNIFNGKFISSEQFDLVKAFTSTPEHRGYLFVINLDNQLRAVSREEVEKIVAAFEAAQKK
jgi:hypothetical protein